MSLGNRFNSNTIIIQEVVRNPRTESFGDSFFKDVADAIGPAANITNSIYRKKAMRAISKRNCVLQNESEYITMLTGTKVGNHRSVSGNMTESNIFEYISRYCMMEIAVHKRNAALGTISRRIEEKLQNPPGLNEGHFSRIQYCNSIICMCMMDRAKVSAKKLIAWIKAKTKKN